MTDTLRSAGGQLTTWVDAGEPGDMIVVLDREGAELGRATAAATETPGTVRARFNPPVQLPAARELYQITNVTKEERDARERDQEADREDGAREVQGVDAAQREPDRPGGEEPEAGDRDRAV